MTNELIASLRRILDEYDQGVIITLGDAVSQIEQAFKDDGWMSPADKQKAYELVNELVAETQKLINTAFVFTPGVLINPNEDTAADSSH